MSNLRDNPNIVNEVADLRRDLDELALNSGGGGGAVQSVDGKTGAVIIHKDLTQAQYNALSQAEKMNGVEYFITDTSGSLDYADGEWHKVGMTKITAEQTGDIIVNIPTEMQSGVWEFKAESVFEERTNNVAGNYWIQLKATTTDNALAAVNNTRWYNQGTGGAGVVTEVWQNSNGWNGAEVLVQGSYCSFTIEANWSMCAVGNYWNFKSTAGGVFAGSDYSALYIAGGRIKSANPITSIRLSCISQPSGGTLWFRPNSRVTVYARKIN